MKNYQPPTIQDMIQAALSAGDGMSKLAEEAEAQAGEACKECGRPAVSSKELCAECAEKKAKEEAKEEQSQEQEKTSSARITKLAAALRYTADHLHEVRFTPGRIKSATEAGSDAGPGHGPNTIPLSLPTEETMPQDLLGQARTPGPSEKMEAGANPLAAAASPRTDADKAMPANPLHFQGTAKTGSIVERMMRAGALLKRAADDAGEGGDIKTPHVKGTGFPEDQPPEVKRPAEVTSQEKALATNEAAIDLTKAEAMAVPKKQLAEVLDEPAMSASTDKTLDNALGASVVDEAGAKIAAARSILQKLASQGCTCDKAKPNESCQACTVASRLGMKKEGRAGASPTSSPSTDQVQA